MSRLTNAIRSDISDKLIDRAFNERETVLLREEYALALELLKAKWGEHYETALKIPLNMVYADNAVWCFGVGLRLEYPTFAPKNHIDENPPPAVLAMKAEIEAFDEKKSALRTEMHNARVEVRNMLRSVATYKRLYEIWPELKTVVSVVEAPDVGKAMVPDLSALNKTLGLPAEVV